MTLPPRMKIDPVFHASLLDPHHANTIPGRTQPPPPVLTVEDALKYEVKEILDSRVRNNKLEYLVDWVGYAPHERSWEPATYLDHAPRRSHVITNVTRSSFRSRPPHPSPSSRPRRSSVVEGAYCHEHVEDRIKLGELGSSSRRWHVVFIVVATTTSCSQIPGTIVLVLQLATSLYIKSRLACYGS